MLTEPSKEATSVPILDRRSGQEVCIGARTRKQGHRRGFRLVADYPASNNGPKLGRL